ncbi:MAG TPA: patatin-like phospholipase family protein [Pseudonocardia sp.]|jgi:NTE family protein
MSAPGRSSGGGRGLVLGAGGFLGAAWSLGALAAVQEVTGRDMSGVDLVVGTSAGSVLAALLRAGRSVEDLCEAYQDDHPAPGSPGTPPLHLDMAAEASHPGLPHPGLGSLPLLLRAARREVDVPATALCAALLPRGRRRLTSVSELIRAAHHGRPWPDGTWLVAMNYRTGERTPLGRDGAPGVPIEHAVAASCAVPAWYEPVTIGGVPYIDGAVASPCNADLVAPAGLDEVYVLAPMASFDSDRPTSPLARLERWWRGVATRRTLLEAERLRAAGTRVRVLAPNARDLAVMGVNMMDGSRRAAVLRTARDSVLRELTGAPPVSVPAEATARPAAAAVLATRPRTGPRTGPARPRADRREPIRPAVA